MYKVLIIDDEEPVRDAIRILGEWERLGIDTILEATDGKEGIGKVDEYRPDIILVDMRMSEMDGIELLKAVEKDYPEVCSIVISGYNDFEYTRQAIKSKVVDYLLKPVNGEELNNALAKAIDIIDEKSRKRNDDHSRNITLNMSLPALREKIFTSILDRSFNEKFIPNYLKIIGADDRNKDFVVAVHRIMNLESVSRKHFGQDVEYLYQAFIQFMDGLSDERLQCFNYRNPKDSREIITVVAFEKVKKDMVKGLIYENIKKVANKLNDSYGAVSLSAIGSLCHKVTTIGESYDSAENILYSVNLIKMKDTVYTQIANTEYIENVCITSKIPLIKNALESNNQNLTRHILFEHLEKIKESGYLSLKDAYKSINVLISVMGDIALSMGVPMTLPLEGYENRLKSLGIGVDFYNYEGFESIMYAVMDFFSNRIRQHLVSFSNFDIRIIKDYIDKNYFEDIKVTMFVDKFYMSREYLMKLFKQKFGCGIYEYVQKIRMEKAKELLYDGSIKIQYISRMLGYSDHNYFSKAFRHYYGITPSDYRAVIMRKDS